MQNPLARAERRPPRLVTTYRAGLPAHVCRVRVAGKAAQHPGPPCLVGTRSRVGPAGRSDASPGAVVRVGPAWAASLGGGGRRSAHPCTDGSAPRGPLISPGRPWRGGSREVQVAPEEVPPDGAQWVSTGLQRHGCGRPEVPDPAGEEVSGSPGKRTLAPGNGGHTKHQLDVQAAGERPAGRLPVPPRESPHSGTGKASASAARPGRRVSSRFPLSPWFAGDIGEM